MKMKLKTLKDIEKQDWSTHEEDIGLVKSVFFDLKQEAIKEIKYSESSEDGTKGLFGGDVDFMFTKDVIGYIKWKFNITDEELK